MKLHHFRKTFLSTVIAAAALYPSAEASILINFSQVGGDIHAVAIGDYTVGASSSWSSDFSLDLAFVGDDRIGYADSSIGTEVFSGGTEMDNFDPTRNFSSASGTNFGFLDGLLYLQGADDDAAPADGTKIDVNTTFVWVGQTLGTTMSLNGTGSGTAGFNATPTVVYTAANGETVSVAVVPEPSSSLLIGLGGLALMIRHRR